VVKRSHEQVPRPFTGTGLFYRLSDDKKARIALRRNGKMSRAQPAAGVRILQSRILFYRLSDEKKPIGSHCGGMEKCRVRNPPQA